MKEENKNIISKVSWITSCSDKVILNQYQDILSFWTNRNLSRILEEIFVELVPEEETWFIDKLEIDIGSFELNCLENELSSCVLEELKKELLILAQKNLHKTKPKRNSMTDGVYIKNAGIVLINAYFPILFERLLLTEENRFKSIEKQHSAVHYMQFVATGKSQTEDIQLPLNNILCGLQPLEPLLSSVTISESEVNLITEMINAIINQWSSIGKSSVDSFRVNWLLRDGILREDTDKWILTVKKMAYDVLIDTIPFSFSIIKYPWMEKPLHVNWM